MKILKRKGKIDKRQRTVVVPCGAWDLAPASVLTCLEYERYHSTLVLTWKFISQINLSNRVSFERVVSRFNMFCEMTATHKTPAEGVFLCD